MRAPDEQFQQTGFAEDFADQHAILEIVARQGGFVFHTLAWQAATVFFAVIDLVAAVGLWLTAAWGAVVWLTATVSMVMVQLVFPQVYGFNAWLVLGEIMFVGCYLWLAIKSAQERPT